MGDLLSMLPRDYNKIRNITDEAFEDMLVTDLPTVGGGDDEKRDDAIETLKRIVQDATARPWRTILRGGADAYGFADPGRNW